MVSTLDPYGRNLGLLGRESLVTRGNRKQGANSTLGLILYSPLMLRTYVSKMKLVL
jgi:hypothetical protein